MFICLTCGILYGNGTIMDSYRPKVTHVVHEVLFVAIVASTMILVTPVGQTENSTY